MQANGNFTLRNGAPSDLAALNEIIKLSKGYWGYDKAFMDAFMHHYSLNENDFSQMTIKVLCKDGMIIGHFSFRLHDDHQLELEHLFLHPSYIGKGLGKHLWKECCAVASKLGAKDFILWSDPEAEPFYAKMGCKKIGIRKSKLMNDRYPPIMKYELPETNLI